MLRLFTRADPEKQAARKLFRALVVQARRSEFHTRFKVPDTIDGRFDLLTLHAFLTFEALKVLGPAGERTGTHLASAIFESLDEALRELGVGDIGISHRIKAMANAFYGRLSAYSEAADADNMAGALLRNLYRGDEARRAEAGDLAVYVVSGLARVRASGPSDLLGGKIEFAPLPQGSAPE